MKMSKVRELLTKEGAETLRKELEDYWGNQKIKFSLEAFSKPHAKDRALYGVRSNMVNGWPPK